VKTLIVKARRSLSAGGSVELEERSESTTEALRALDRAAAKGILHPNNAARRKARLARQLAKLAAAAPATATSGKGKKPAPAAPAKKR
jgi:small subunit ribosomal protein S20